jgi:hypothetical protein
MLPVKAAVETLARVPVASEQTFKLHCVSGVVMPVSKQMK